METILFIDDENIMIDVVPPLLERMGYNVLTAKNGREAINIYKSKKGEIDAVIIDLIMPGMSGGEVFDYLKNINPNIKTILASGADFYGEAAEILKRGCNNYIQKPFSFDDLSKTLRYVLDKV